ncbi:4478_t:CDS:1, partial [Dentiscutata heterogama]
LNWIRKNSPNHDDEEQVKFAIRNSLMTMFLRTSQSIKYLDIVGYLDHNMINRISMSRITSLELSHTELNHDGIRALKKLITCSTTLSSLILFRFTGLGFTEDLA